MRTFSLPKRISQGELNPRRQAFAARAPGHVQGQRTWSISNELLASAALLSLVLVGLFGPIGVLAFMGMTGLLVLQQPKRNLSQVLFFAPLLLIPLLAMLSAEWSDAPANSMRAGLQLLLTFIAAILIARNMRPERMVLILFIGYAAICIAVVPDVPASLSSGMPLYNAILGSKNQVAFSAFMLGTLSLALMIDPAQPRLWRLAAIAAIPVALGMLYLARSGGGTSSFLIALIVIPGLATLCWLNFGARLAVVVFMVGVLAIALIFLADIETAITSFRTGTLNKDATLTGRTYLWEVADRLSEKRPWLGLGYGAFWIQGNIEAEGLWRWGGIANRSGFNFHNSFVAMKVELGRVGVGLLFATCAVIGLAGLIRQILRPTMAMACLVGLLVVAYTRSYVEDTLVSPFNVLTILWLATMIYALTPGIESVRTGLSVDRARKVV